MDKLIILWVSYFRTQNTEKDGEVMKKRISMIIAFVLALILLASCAPRQGQPQASPSPSPSPAETSPNLHQPVMKRKAIKTAKKPAM